MLEGVAVPDRIGVVVEVVFEQEQQDVQYGFFLRPLAWPGREGRGRGSAASGVTTMFGGDFPFQLQRHQHGRQGCNRQSRATAKLVEIHRIV